MRSELVGLFLVVGLCNWAFRFFPTRMDVSAMPARDWLSRFLSATGPAAIATLLAASVLPMVQVANAAMLPLVAGTAAVGAVFYASRSVVAATLAGSLAYGTVFALA